MKLCIFLSVLSTHQEGLCNSFFELLGDDFKAVLFGKLPDYRQAAGFKDLSTQYPYCVVLSEEQSDRNKQLEKLAEWTDIGIVGGVSNSVIDILIKHNKQCFLFSERFYKAGIWRRFVPTTIKKVKARYRNHPNYKVLCASAYLPYDLQISGYHGELLQWGYFPQIEKSNELRPTQSTCPTILWVGRLISWKHPETLIKVVDKLRHDGLQFHVNMIGYGELKDKVMELIQKKNLSDYITLMNSMPPTEVHKMMRKTDIFLATSDYNEGWGVVINEAMTQGCAVVASSAMGSVPYMIKDGVNGYACKYDDVDQMYHRVKSLIIDQEKRNELSRNAMRTMVEDYSPQIAAKRFCEYCDGKRFESGICSNAVVRKT